MVTIRPRPSPPETTEIFQKLFMRIPPKRLLTVMIAIVCAVGILQQKSAATIN